MAYPSEAESESYIAQGAWHRSTVGDALRATAARVPQDVALVCGDERLSYAEYDEQSERLGGALLALGLKPGDRVIFQMGNAIETAIALLACFKAALIPVCTLPQHREMEIGTISRLTGAAGYFVQRRASRSFDLVGFARAMAEGHPTLRHLIVTDGLPDAGDPTIASLVRDIPHAEARGRLAEIAIAPDDVLVFQLSGGTTGTPKVIPRLHGEYLGYCQAWTDMIGLKAEDPGLWALPLIHNAAMIYHLVPALMQGRKLVLMERFDIVEFFRTIEREHVAITGSIGPIAAMILDYADAASHDLSSIKLFTTLSRASAIEAHLNVPVVNVYGISEGALTASSPDDPVEARHNSVGRPVSPFDEFKLLAPRSDQEVPPGTAGELAFKGPSSIRGYFGSTEASLSADGFFRTGDLMSARTVGASTYFAFEGRIKDNIDRGGEKFGPEEVENMIVRHEAIADAKVVAMPDPVYGEKACAFIVPYAGKRSPDVDALAHFLETLGVARFKIPERIEIIDSFPLTRVGKIDRATLRRIIAERIAAESHSTPMEQTI
ncbi:AMP-binding protein [Sphingomonas sp. SRS2]|uniref:AMP-binding protein n=1 Tax=Sphingomonas sp. SRS2 TaxID=133190 RepID=UPI0019101707|nr:AMP-binding protein [Sphingomonas sp. SRS2]